jgi:hypothetical protein
MSLKRLIGISLVLAVIAVAAVWLMNANARALCRDVRWLARTEKIELKKLKGHMKSSSRRGSAHGTLSADEAARLTKGLALTVVPPEILGRRWDVIYKKVHGAERPNRDPQAVPLTPEEERMLEWYEGSPCREIAGPEWRVYRAPASVRVSGGTVFSEFGLFWNESDGATCWDATYSYG